MEQIAEKKSGAVSLPKLILLGISGSLANNAIMWLSSSLSLGLYLDLIFTVALVFLAGLIPGLICAFLSTAIYGIIYNFVFGTPYYWVWYFFILCSVASCFLVLLFQKLFYAEKRQFFGTIIMLVLLSFTMCIVLSIIGGIISACISMTGNVVPDNIPPETWFRLGFIRQGFSLLTSEILSRIPVNLADKFIAVFAGFGAAFLIKKIFIKTELRGEQ